MSDPREYLAGVIGLIGSDISRLKHLSELNRRPRGYSNDLQRYARTLLDMIAYLDGAEQEQNQAVRKLSNDELARLAREALATMGDKA